MISAGTKDHVPIHFGAVRDQVFNFGAAGTYEMEYVFQFIQEENIDSKAKETQYLERLNILIIDLLDQIFFHHGHHSVKVLLHVFIVQTLSINIIF